MKSLAAFTAPTGDGYPPYLNFSLDGDEVVVILREPPFIGEHGFLVNGNTASMRMPFEDFVNLVGDAFIALADNIPDSVRQS